MANVEDFPVERWDAIIAINLTSAFHTMRLALPAMKQRGWGRVINIASAHGLVASAQQERLRGGQARHRGPHQGGGTWKPPTTGITVNAICPGWVLTPLVQKQIDAPRGRRPA